MVDTLRHKFISAKSQSPDPTLVSKNEWNDDHEFAGGVNGEYLMYDSAENGKFVFDNVWARQPWVDPTQAPYGIDKTGSSDVSAPLNAVIAAVPNGTVFVFPPGLYRLVGSIIVSGKEAISFIGSPGNTQSGTRFLWYGSGSSPALRVLGSRDCTFRGFTIDAIGGFLDTGIACETLSGVSITNSKFVDIYLDGNSAGNMNYGFTTIRGTGGDNNNEFNEYDRCTVVHFAIAAFAFQHPQGKHHTLTKCVWAAASYKYGVVAAEMAGGVPIGPGAGFNIYGGGGGGSTEAEFYVYSTGLPIVICGVSVEESAAFGIFSSGGTGAYGGITIIGCSFQSFGLRSDNRIITSLFSSGICVINSHFADVTFGAGEFYVNAGGATVDGARGGLTFINCHIESTRVNPFTGTANGVTAIGCSIDRNDGAGIAHLPTQFPYFGTAVIATANLPAAAADNDGRVVIENAGAGDRNLIIYANGERFRIDGGVAF